MCFLKLFHELRESFFDSNKTDILFKPILNRLLEIYSQSRVLGQAPILLLPQTWQIQFWF